MKNYNINDELWEDTFNEIDEKINEYITFEGLDYPEEFSNSGFIC